jgi:5-methylcytosine-specific restriction endonuclease McrA
MPGKQADVHALPTGVLRGEKTCTNSSCQETLPYNQFSRDRQKKDGYASRCKACCREYQASWYRDNAKKIQVQHANYRQLHREELRRKEHAYQKVHRAQACQRAARYRTAHPERVHVAALRHRTSHPERVRASAMRWRIANPEKLREQWSNRRARKRGAPIRDFTCHQWREMKALYHHRCMYCGQKSRRLTQDHIMPLAKGGAHTWSNIVPACQSCNSRKGTKAPLKAVQGLLNIV